MQSRVLGWSRRGNPQSHAEVRSPRQFITIAACGAASCLRNPKGGNISGAYIYSVRAATVAVLRLKERIDVHIKEIGHLRAPEVGNEDLRFPHLVQESVVRPSLYTYRMRQHSLH